MDKTLQGILQAMMDEAFRGILLAVVTSVITTLIVEYFAKPKLEARKNRIIRDRNQIDEVIFCFQELALKLGTVNLPENAPINALKPFILTNAADADKTIEKLQAAIARLHIKYVERLKKHIPASMQLLGFIKAELFNIVHLFNGQKDTEAIEALMRLAKLTDSLSLADRPFEALRRNFFIRALHRDSIKRNSADLEDKMRRLLSKNN